MEMLENIPFNKHKAQVGNIHASNGIVFFKEEFPGPNTESQIFAPAPSAPKPYDLWVKFLHRRLWRPKPIWERICVLQTLI